MGWMGWDGGEEVGVAGSGGGMGEGEGGVERGE